MILLITIPLAIIISLCWYIPVIRAQGDRRVLQNKDYWRIALVYGFLFTCLLIMITEIIWDSLIKRTGLTGLTKDIIADFFRAALLEEFFKFIGFILAKRKYALTRKNDFITTAGMMGLMYGLFEKVVLGNVGAIIVGLLIPMHILWQFNQGGHYFEYEKAKAEGNQQLAQKEWRMAVLVPFLFHGCWDSGLDIGAHLLTTEGSTISQIAGILIIVAMVALGIVYAVKTMKKVLSIAKEEPATLRFGAANDRN